MQDETDQLLVPFLAEPLDEAMAGKRFAGLVGRETILGKAEVEERGDGDRRRSDLLLLLAQVGAADEANSCLLSHLVQKRKHFRGYRLRIAI